MRDCGPNLQAHINRMPPWQCRMIAWRQRTRDIAGKAGIPYWLARQMSWAETWDAYKVKDIQAFTTACGIDLLHQKYPRDKFNKIVQSMDGKGGPLKDRRRAFWLALMGGRKDWRTKS